MTPGAHRPRSNRTPPDAVSSWPDAEQRRLLERLVGGEPVTFAQLRESGIEFPAMVVSELELVGYPIERVHEHGQAVGVRLGKSHSAGGNPLPAAPQSGPPPRGRAAAWRGLSRARVNVGCLFVLLLWLALWAAIAAGALIAIR